MILYKYRGLSNIEFALDIFVNQRLYAATFEMLNDPMEAVFIYKKGALDPDKLSQIQGEKAAYNILSLSKTHNNMLMWSYYSEGHSGFVVGVSIEDVDASVEPIDYVANLKLSNISGDIAKSILTKKLKLWWHEKEHRAFKNKHKGNFINVKPLKLIFGLKASNSKKELMTSIAKKFCPDIEVSNITSSELDRGEHNECGFWSS